ncbi:MAG: ATP-binding protein [Oxalicibacterium faecigallinarum]|uniref:ATP-binding protein n=1 Tax=Oxalicibacterium faecigallinarum TaxID=573741 RepID=UPI002806C026|nr:ATP-binding protein [Oxalicibacterium faecigallinarum]MDQ7969267.1 ATP-binding protein [Oxalicibacterium faecigallinarum]
MKWFWPRSLTGRLVIIMVIGMLSAQLMTGTIWFDMRYGKAMEVPTRLVASELALRIRLLETLPLEQQVAMLAKISSPHFTLKQIDQPAESTRTETRHQAVAMLFENVLEQQLGQHLPTRILKADLQNRDGSESSFFSLLREDFPEGHFVVQVELPDRRWLEVNAHEGQAGLSMAPQTALYDYLMRIYVLRIIAIVAIALIVVRLVMKPLKKLANAAEQLGENIHSPPLDVTGPDEVKQAAQAFNIMQRKLIDGIAERTRFLAAVSHDLRSPITRMKLRTEMLKDEAAQAKFRKDLEEMEAMVTSTLHFVRNIDTEEQLRNVDINALLESLKIDAEEIGSQVTLHGKAQPLPAYARSLRRCVQNLLENAIRYGQAAHIEVVDTPAQLQIIISDQGPGIPPELLEQVMEPFMRVEGSRNTHTGGFGLGLSIARTVAQAHRGRLTLRNREAGGLEVTLTLPRTNKSNA